MGIYRQKSHILQYLPYYQSPRLNVQRTTKRQSGTSRRVQGSASHKCQSPETTPAGALASERSLLHSWSTWEGSACRYWSITQILLWISRPGARSCTARACGRSSSLAQRASDGKFWPENNATGDGPAVCAWMRVALFEHCRRRHARAAATRVPPCAGGELGVGLGDAVSWLPSPSKWAATQVVGEKNA